MKHIVSIFADLIARFQIPNIAINKAESLPLFICYRIVNLIQIVPVTGGKVIKPNDILVQLQKRFQDVGSDETGNACYKLDSWVFRKVFLDLFVCGHFL